MVLVPEAVKQTGPSFLDAARAVLRQGYIDAWAGGYEDAYPDAEPDEYDEDAATYADTAVDGQHGFLAGLAAALTVGSLSAAQIDARMGSYAATANPVYERGFSASVQDQGDVVQVRWESSGDDDVCELCAERDGETWGEGEDYPFPGEGGFGEYCILEGTLVASPRIAKGYRRPYSGPVVRLTAARASIDPTDRSAPLEGFIQLAVTPNHPILTVRGWIAAKFLEPGDDVVCGTFGKEVLLADADVQQTPAAIEQVYRSLAGRYPVDRHSGRCVEFHGDGIEDAEVEVVASDRLLLDTADTTDGQPICEDLFASPAVCPCGLSLARSLGHRILGLVGASPSYVGSGRDGSALGGRSAPVERKLSGAAITQSNAHGTQTANDDPSIEATVTRQLVDGLTVEVTLAQIVQIEHGYYTGHVYNLRTGTGWYLAGQSSATALQILVSNCAGAYNCRCSLIYEMVPAEEAAAAAEEEPALVEAMSTSMLAKIQRYLRKYSEDQPRDEAGRWADEAGASSAPERTDAWAMKAIGDARLLPADQKDALTRYIGLTYPDINRALRAGEDRPETAAIDRAMAATTIREPVTVFRGIEAEAIPTGVSGFRDDAYVSTTLLRDTADMVANYNADSEGGHPMIMEIGVPAGSHGLFLGPLGDDYHGEKGGLSEVLLPRGSEFRVTSDTTTDGVRHLRAVLA